MPGDLQKALALIDDAHAQDPNKITVNDTELPYELHYAQKCTAYLERRVAKAQALADSSGVPADPPTDALRLAVRAQHLRRWEVPRADYPMTKPGYFKWRTYLKQRQGELAAGYCREAGYDDGVCERVAALVRKEDLNKQDSETQALEDVACLVFLDDQFEQFSGEHSEEKILGILRKTWGKMGEAGQALALELNMEGRPKELLDKALNG